MSLCLPGSRSCAFLTMPLRIYYVLQTNESLFGGEIAEPFFLVIADTHPLKWHQKKLKNLCAPVISFGSNHPLLIYELKHSQNRSVPTSILPSMFNKRYRYFRITCLINLLGLRIL